MNKVIFLDRDGVINREIGNYVYNIKDFVINDGLEQALDIWDRDGYSFVIVTNQGGIFKGLYHKNDVEDINVFLRNWFESRKLILLNILFPLLYFNNRSVINKYHNDRTLSLFSDRALLVIFI